MKLKPARQRGPWVKKREKHKRNAVLMVITGR